MSSDNTLKVNVSPKAWDILKALPLHSPEWFEVVQRDTGITREALEFMGAEVVCPYGMDMSKVRDDIEVLF